MGEAGEWGGESLPSGEDLQVSSLDSSGQFQPHGHWVKHSVSEKTNKEKKNPKDMNVGKRSVGCRRVDWVGGGKGRVVLRVISSIIYALLNALYICTQLWRRNVINNNKKNWDLKTQIVS